MHHVTRRKMGFLPRCCGTFQLYQDLDVYSVVQKDAKNLIWHADGREKDGLLRHPVDSPQWIKIDNDFQEFEREKRNLRLALATDGMNPFSGQSSTYSVWPVILVIYNLPPELCMKRKYMLLSMLISGPKQPGNDIDVYLAPLIEDLKMLWNMGVTTRKHCFTDR